jgi:hypothetical protein
MNRVYAFARVIVGILAMYFSIRVLVMIMSTVIMLQTGRDDVPVGWVLLSVVISILCLVALQYFGLYRPERVVRRITSGIEVEQPLSDAAWLPAAYRLICLYAGLACLSRPLLQLPSIITQYAYYAEAADSGRTAHAPSAQYLLTAAICLVVGVYLLAGAPHFVRWHLRKTAAFCRERAVE